MDARRTSPSDKRTNSALRADAGAPHIASDRAPVSAGLYIPAAARARAFRSILPRAEGSPASGADVPQLEISRGRQLVVEGQVQGSGY